jgi:hypothetical protein
MEDPLLRKIRLAKASSRATSDRAEQARRNDPVEKARAEATQVRLFLIQVAGSLGWIYWRLLEPALRAVVWRPGKWLFHWYRRQWERWTRKNGRFSITRGAAMLMATSLIIYFPVFAVLELFWDASWYLMTAKRDEVVYLTSSQEIDSDRDVHNVKGCETKPCQDQNSLYFRVRPTMFNHLWSVFHNGDVFYPDYVAGAVAPGMNRCTITSYGIRFKFIMRRMEGLNVYPDLLAARCVTEPG